MYTQQHSEQGSSRESNGDFRALAGLAAHPSDGGARPKPELVLREKPRQNLNESERGSGILAKGQLRTTDDLQIDPYQIPTPREINLKLRRHVAGNRVALFDVSLFVHDHLRRTGSYFSVQYVRKLIEGKFSVVPGKEDQARELTYAITKIARNNKVRTSDKEQVFKDVYNLLKLAVKQEILVPDKQAPEKELPEEQLQRREWKKKVKSITVAIGNKREARLAEGLSFRKEDLRAILARRFVLPEGGVAAKWFERWLSQFHNSVAKGETSPEVGGTLWEKVDDCLSEGKAIKYLAEKQLKRGERIEADPVRSRAKKILKNLQDSQNRANELNSGFGGKQNLCLIGDTGSGKTQIARAVKAVLPAPIPFIMEDATAYTEAGYDGLDVSGLGAKLLEAANGDPIRASIGVIYIDEIDKKRQAASSGTDRDVAGAGVQHALLRLMEDGIDQETGIDFSTVSFMFGGAFMGLAEIIGRRTGQTNIGFLNTQGRDLTGTARAEIVRKVSERDLEEYGMVREWVGRTTIATTEPVGSEQLRRIMEHATSPVRRMIELLEQDDIHVEITPDGKEALIQKALEMNIGARALGKIMRELTKEARFFCPELNTNRSRVLTINAQFIRERLGSS